MYSKNYIGNIIENVEDAIAISDKSGSISFFSQGLLGLFGFQKEDMIDKSIYHIFEGFDEFKNELEDKTSMIGREVSIHARKNKLKFTLSMYKLENDYLFKFEDIKKERKLSNKIKHNKAIYTFDKIISQDKYFKEQIEFAKKISDSKSTVIIMGETGTGKEIFAQSIHNKSNRSDKPFIAINSAAIPDSLIESELFGYAPGSFTGAKKEGQIGKFESANKGTIFLDEIGEMPLNLQTRLLRVIEEGIVTRIGAVDQVSVDVRIIAASNKNLKKEVEKGNFRKDLFYRLNVLPLTIIPLRKRKKDIPLLINFFMERISNRLNKKKVEINEKEMKELMEYNWPGNVREIENFIELVINIGYVPKNHFNHISCEVETNSYIKKENITLEELEAGYIKDLLDKNQGNISETAKILDIGRNTLYRKIKKYRL